MKKMLFGAIITAAVFVLALAGCRKASEILPADVPTPIALPVYPISILIDNMDDNNNTNEWGGIWFTYDDTKPPNFGSSLVFPRNGATFTMTAVGPDWNSVAFGPNIYAARFYGTTIKDAAYPLIGVGCTLNIAETPLDISSYTKLVFYAKNGKYNPAQPVDDPASIYNFTVSFKNSINPDPALYDTFKVNIGPSGVTALPTRNMNLKGDWVQIIIPFADMHAAAWGAGFPGGATTEAEYRALAFTHTQSIQIQTSTDETNPMAPGETQAVDLWIDKVMLIRD